MMDAINKITSEAVQKATGKTWDAWLALLDGDGAARLDHKGIVRLLTDKHGVSSGWWQQEITVGYEIARGKRAEGQTADAGYEVGVSKTLPVPAEQAWKVLTSEQGLKTWLGTAPHGRLMPGLRYRTRDGVSGEFRTVREYNHLRLTWFLNGWERASTLQVRVMPQGDKSSVNFHQERLSGEMDRERLRRHWREVLERLAELAAGN
jgi:uncharacterized protein YndB with AHSA1/START domain